jgi:hypothetical protein
MIGARKRNNPLILEASTWRFGVLIHPVFWYQYINNWLADLWPQQRVGTYRGGTDGRNDI